MRRRHRARSGAHCGTLLAGCHPPTLKPPLLLSTVALRPPNRTLCHPRADSVPFEAPLSPSTPASNMAPDADVDAARRHKLAKLSRTSLGAPVFPHACAPVAIPVPVPRRTSSDAAMHHHARLQWRVGWCRSQRRTAQTTSCAACISGAACVP
ncbi:hypothetical protein GGX14DRAFT_581201 [Mycena pura]|uniref:Uncharacterized protein n=1 Tax=Mycena pura TaxID=153505 RepID=A0AAD6UK49_9AGAR|nr:hypothetical protein GGX14DRAFT_581201 [Mycena pura]